MTEEGRSWQAFQRERNLESGFEVKIGIALTRARGLGLSRYSSRPWDN